MWAIMEGKDQRWHLGFQSGRSIEDAFIQDLKEKQEKRCLWTCWT